MRMLLGALALAAVTGSPALAMETSLGRLEAQAVVTGLHGPWAFDFLPDGTILITERRGRLIAVSDGHARRITGLPEVRAEGQGGLLDLLVPEDFAQSRELFLTYSRPQGGGSGTAVLRARLSRDGTALEDAQTIFEMAPGDDTTRHYGSRLVEARDGTLFVTLGERGNRPAAQDLSRHNGKVIRINRDGSVPADNPFAGRPDARPEIWSYGHRNPQGAALDGAGQLWVNEHGARGGDEVNRIARGANYGWPVIAYGRHYSGARIGEGTEKEGMEQPELYWDPSIAPSGMVFVKGGRWDGDALVGSLKFDYIARLSGDPLREVEQLTSPETARVRDVGQGPDGAVWFLSEGQGALFRLIAAE